MPSAKGKKNEAGKEVEMTLTSCILFLILVIPAIQALPTEKQPAHSPTDEQCDLDLQVSNKNEIGGVFETSDLKIIFRAKNKNKEIHATTSIINPSDDASTISVHLSLPDIEGRVVPNIEKLIVQRAVDLVESTNCKIPTNLNILHEELADKLYQCTKEMVMSQLRFSIMYLETVVASAQRICNGAESICTASPKYTYGEGLFICEEDLEELYKELMNDDTEKEKTTRKEDHEMSPEKEGEKVKRGIWCPGITGRDHGCCGNYAGQCYYCSLGCYLHDRACTQCQYWHCGPACRPDEYVDENIPRLSDIEINSPQSQIDPILLSFDFN